MNHSKMFLSFYLFFFYISSTAPSSHSSNGTHRCPAIQSQALYMFKQNVFSFGHSYEESHAYNDACYDWLGSEYHPVMTNWNMSIDCCNWNGVKCNHFTGDVIGLDLSCGMLQGTINPNTTLFHLPHLQRLNLAINDFSNSYLPHGIGRLSNSLTHLNISYCAFVGRVPTSITHLHKLVSLDLSWNSFEGQLQPHVFHHLLQNSTHLRELSLSSVDISQNVATCVNISSSLKSLKLYDTNLHGKLPDSMFRYLEKLDLSYNTELTSRWPKVNSSTSLPLKWLDLSSTKGLSGEIPDSIGHLKYLNTLNLNSCGLMGPLPKILNNLKQLTSIDLSNNLLSGTLPSLLFTVLSLESLNLEGNMFNGSLPSELFTSQSLKNLFLGNNQFNGEINVLDQGPILPTFQQLVNLTALSLRYNNFRGDCVLETLLSSLPNLEVLDLSYSGLSVLTNNVNCNVNPRFRYLRLGSCKLTVFPETLRAMKNLTYFDLSNNKIHGHIPDWVGEIGANELFYLNLSHNFITSLPKKFEWDRLDILDLQSNLIQGPFPPSICNLNRLWHMDISNNNFSGVIPQCFGNISTSIWMIDMTNNRFHGTIPDVFEHCGQLDGLILNGNQLQGEVPRSLSDCRWLRVLDLGNNNLTGAFPDWSARLPWLQVLVLKSNKFHGLVETSSVAQHPFPSLKVLDLSQNEFTGHLPRKYFQNFDAMKNVVKTGETPAYLSFGYKYYSIIVMVKGSEFLFSKLLADYTIVDLSKNRFDGQIPDVIGSLNSLKVLNLSHNRLNDHIPHALGNLLEIESLDLSWNQLTGHIPQSLAEITGLEVLDISENDLVGRIPEGPQFRTFNSTSFEGNPGLCGFPLPKHCEHLSDPLVEAEEDEESGFTWNMVMLGYGCGTVVGLALGYLMLSTGRPKWFNAIANAGEQMILRRQNRRRHIYIGK